MRNAIRVAGVVAALVVCGASATGYRDSYRDTNLGGGRYMVAVKVTNRTGMGTAQEYAYKRAAEVCSGRGFDVIDGAAATEDRPYAITTANGSTSGTAQANCRPDHLGGANCSGAYRGNTTATATTITGNAGKHEVVLIYQCRGAGGVIRSGGSVFDGQ